MKGSVGFKPWAVALPNIRPACGSNVRKIDPSEDSVESRLSRRCGLARLASCEEASSEMHVAKREGSQRSCERNVTRDSRDEFDRAWSHEELHSKPPEIGVVGSPPKLNVSTVRSQFASRLDIWKYDASKPPLSSLHNDCASCHDIADCAASRRLWDPVANKRWHKCASKARDFSA